MADDRARVRNLRLLTEEEVEQRRPVLLAGVEQFNRGYFFEAHETWEELWLPSPWPLRQFLQGLIQVSAGFVHLMRHEYPGTGKLLGAGLAKLREFPASYLGVDNGRLIEEAGRALEELAALGPDALASWERARIPYIHMTSAEEEHAVAATRLS